MSLIIRNVVLPLAAFTLKVNAEIHGRVAALFGPSGAGKTSLLDLVAGLRQAKSAFIQLNDHVLTDASRRLHVPARRRGIGYVPQDTALFPHLTVRQNLLYGHKPANGQETLFQLNHVVDVLEIQSLLDRSTLQLSGGEKQRVALARALLSAPRLLLLDEPLASLDTKLKARIMPYLVRVREEFQVPMLYVTHDRFEALGIADQLIVLINGRVEQSGPILDVLTRPASLAVAGMLSVETIQPAQIVQRDQDLVTVAVGANTLLAAEENLPQDARQVFICIRAEDIILTRETAVSTSARNRLAATVRSVSREGPMVRVELDAGFPLVALLTKQACEELALQPQTSVLALIKAPHVHLIAR